MKRHAEAHYLRYLLYLYFHLRQAIPACDDESKLQAGDEGDEICLFATR